MAVPDPEDRDPPAIAYIGLGSNLESPRLQVLAALGELAALRDCTLLARSSLYATAPVGPIKQPDYVNAAAALETRLAPQDLLAALQGVEGTHGRVRNGTRWGPRTLDLDILLYGDLTLQEPGLHVPHPEIAHRAFVLAPLAEIAPRGMEVPGQGGLQDLLAACPGGDGIRRIPDEPPEAGKHGVEELSSPPA